MANPSKRFFSFHSGKFFRSIPDAIHPGRQAPTPATSLAGVYKTTYLVKHVLDKLNLVLNFSTTQNGKEWRCGRFKCFCEIVQFFLQQETGCTLIKTFSHHRTKKKLCNHFRLIECICMYNNNFSGSRKRNRIN